MTYTFHWRAELGFALATFAVYVGTAFLATGDNPVSNWGDWFVATAVAGARAVVAVLIPRIATRGATLAGIYRSVF